MSDIVDVTGTVMYPKLFEHNRDLGSKPGAQFEYKEGTTLELLVDQEELKKISRIKTDLKPKVVEGEMCVKFRRDWVNPRNPAWGGPPVVKDADGNLWDPQIPIGNGSKVRVVAEVYKTKYGYGMRLLGVQVLALVEAVFEDQHELPF